MTYAHITADTIDAVGQPPLLYFDGTRWWDLRDRDPATLALVGWLPVTQTPRPADTATTTHDYSVTLVGGVPTETWTERPKTQAELDADTAATNDTSLISKVQAAVQAGGTLATDLGAASDPAWTPGTPLTLRGWKAMSKADMQALTLAQTQEFLAKLAPLIVDGVVAGRQVGKLAIQLFDEPQ